MAAVRRIAPDLALIAIAFALHEGSIDRGWIENGYANGIYAWLARTFVPIANALPFTLGDVIFIGIGLAAIVEVVRRVRGSRGRRWAAGAQLLFRLAAIAAAILIWFDLAWALNYRREPVIARVAFDEARVTPANVAAFSRTIIDELNAAAPAAHAVSESDDAMQGHLASAFAPVAARLGDRWTVIVSSPKTSLLDRWFATTGVGGMWDPFAYETILNSEFLPFERPFALAHEWGHVAGFGDESDANVIAALTCLRSQDPLVRYAGLFWTYGFLPEDERRRTPVTPLVAADLSAARERFLKHYQPDLFRIQWFTYDKFLRANRISAGVVSYSLFVRTLVGTPLDAAGLPITHELPHAR